MTDGYGVLWLPIAASFVCLVVKVALYLAGVQPFNLRGLPSGHAAVMAALLTHLALGFPETKDALGVAIAFSGLYGSDILLFYYMGPRGRDGLPLGHSIVELTAGVVVGGGVALAYHNLYRDDDETSAKNSKKRKKKK